MEFKDLWRESPEKEKSQNKINKLGSEKPFLLKVAVKNIQEKYLESSINIMSSNVNDTTSRSNGLWFTCDVF